MQTIIKHLTSLTERQTFANLVHHSTWSTHNVDMSGFDPEILKKYGLPSLPDDFEIHGYDNATNFYTSMMNNATALNTHSMDNAFNAEQAQLNRDFNAEQAQIARDWNSEQAVMERRREAGLNIVNPGGFTGGSSGSSAQASGTPASAAAPPQLQGAQQVAPNYAGMAEALVDIAKAPAEITDNAVGVAESLTNVGKLNAETENTRLQSVYQGIMNQYTPKQIESLISFQASQSEKAIQEAMNQPFMRTQISAMTDRLQQEVFKMTLDGILSIQGSNLDLETAIRDTDLAYSQMFNDGIKYGKSLEASILDGSYRYGKVNRFDGSNLYHHQDNIGFGKTHGSTFGLTGSAGVGGSGGGKGLGLGFNFGVSETSSQNKASFDFTQGITTSGFNETFQSSEFQKLGAEIIGTCRLVLGTTNAKVRKGALDNLKNLTRSVEMYMNLQHIFSQKSLMQRDAEAIPTLPY